MAQTPLVSIIINNYNYGRFLRDAIDSALGQEYPAVEVIVVDDGSTDDSHTILQEYGDRIVPVLKGNGGQASALNAGFACCRGEVVIFLDADDMLNPDTASRVVEAFQKDKAIARVQYRLEIVDAAGAPTGQVKPSRERRMPNGDMREQLLRYPDDIAWLPTSGNAFAREALCQILPIPEDTYRVCADYYLLNLSALVGEIRSLEETGGMYRTHGANNHHTARLDLGQVRRTIELTRHTHQHVRTFASALGLIDPDSAPSSFESLSFLVNRMASLKLDPSNHPLAGDRMVPLSWSGARTTVARHDLPARLKVAYLLWLLGLVLAPRPLARRLAEAYFFPPSMDHLERLLRRFRPRRGSEA